MSTIICSVCGEENDYGTKYCKECGAELYYINEEIYFSDIDPDSNEEISDEKAMEEEARRRNEACRITTTNRFEDRDMIEYLDILTVDEFLTFESQRNPGAMYTIHLDYASIMQYMKEIKTQIRIELQERAIARGANGLVGVSYSMTNAGNAGMVISITGTAVKLL